MPSWIPARPTGYGAVPGYRPAAFANGADMAQSSAWRGREVDTTGYIQIGLRPYDPVSGRWLTYDSVWNSGDPDGYSFCAGGDPINYFDPDGRQSMFQTMFPATAAAAGAKPFTGSVAGDVQWVHGVVYPTMQLPFAPLMEPHVQGGLKVIGGASETTIGGLGVATTSETGVGAYVSGLAIAHGADTVQSGWRQMMSGQATPSYTQQGITRLTGSPTIGALGDATLSAVLTFGAGATIESTRLGVSSVTINRVGNSWIKQVNPSASGVAQWWGKMNLNQQAVNLAKLGDMAPNFTYENGILTTADAGKYVPGQFWNTWVKGTMRLGTPFNDIRPRNIGANGIIFDPSKNFIQRGLEATALTGIMYGGYGAYQYGGYMFQNADLTERHHNFVKTLSMKMALLVMAGVWFVLIEFVRGQTFVPEQALKIIVVGGYFWGYCPHSFVN